MIRRGFWFAAGAVAGVVGYRRVSRAARALLPQADLLAPLGRRIAGPAARRTLGRGPRRPDLTQNRVAAAQRAAAGTAAFVRDVRTGMADYLDARRDI